MSCKYHFNWTTDAPCPYCRIDELEQWLAHKQEQCDQLAHQVLELEEQNERDRCHGRDFIRLWKEGKERIAELEQELTEIQTAYDELRLLADGRLSIKPEYVRGLEQQLAEMTAKYNDVCTIERVDLLKTQLAERDAEIALLRKQSVGWVQVFDENAALRAEVERLKAELGAIGYKTLAVIKEEVRKQAAREMLEDAKMLLHYTECYAMNYKTSGAEQVAKEFRDKFGLEG